MASSYDLPDRRSTIPSILKTFSPHVLAYLKAIANNKPPLPAEQSKELGGYTSAGRQPGLLEASNPPSQDPDLETPRVAPHHSAPFPMKDFFDYMASAEGDAAMAPVEQDLTYPISNYFINSSHNTYLTGNQLYSESSTDAYKNVRASLQEEDDLPVIVSLEVHAGHEQQEVMVEIIEQVWRGLLVKPPSGRPEQLPSPGELREKILIKVKYVAPEKVSAPATAEKAAKTRMRRKKSAESSSSSDSDNQGSEDARKQKQSSIIEPLSALGVYTRSYHFKDLSSPEANVPCHVFSLSEKKFMNVHGSHGPTLFSHNRNYLMRAFPSGTRVTSSNLDPAVFWRKGVQIVALNWQKYDAGMMLNEGMFAGSGGWVLKPKEYRGERGGQNAGVSDQSQADAIAHKTLSLSIDILAGARLPLPSGDHDSGGFKPYVKCELHVEKQEERTGAAIEGGGKSSDGEFKRKTKHGRGIDPDFGGERVAFSDVRGVVEQLCFVSPGRSGEYLERRYGTSDLSATSDLLLASTVDPNDRESPIVNSKLMCNVENYRFKILDDEIGKDDLAAWACIRLDRLKSGFRFIRLLDAIGKPSRGSLLVKIEKSLI
ncbi:MAG: hypothetical protein Q9207_002475 [Kuettlingeria erythrocarpa]